MSPIPAKEVAARINESWEKHLRILKDFYEAGGKYSNDPQLYDILTIRDTDLERFFNLAVAAEREACAKVCEDAAHPESGSELAWASRACAAAIRARSKT